MKKADGSIRPLTNETADARLELFRLEGLLHIVVGTRVKRSHDALFITQRAEHQDRHILPESSLANLAKQRESIDPGQHDIQNDHVGWGSVGTDVLLSLQAIMQNFYSIALTLEDKFQKRGNRLIVIDDQGSWRCRKVQGMEAERT